MEFKPYDFTVLMSVYDKADPHSLQIAIDSIYSNSLQPIETILVVDGPVNSTLDHVITSLLRRYVISCYRLPCNVGLSSALNFGLDFVRTPWIARADADDFNLPTRFAAQMHYARLGFDLIGSQIQEVDSSGAISGIRRLPCLHNTIIKFAARRNPFNHMTVVYRTALIKKCGGYPSIYLREDYGLWASSINAGALLVNVDQNLVVATAGSGMVNRRRGFHSASAEIKLQLHLVRCRLKSFPMSVVDFFLRFSLLLLPPFALRVIYRMFLRT